MFQPNFDNDLLTGNLAFYTDNATNIKELTKKLLAGRIIPKLDESKIKVFSHNIINEILIDEWKHGGQTLANQTNLPLTNLSSGQQRKTLLDTILKDVPQCLILESPTEFFDFQNSKDLLDHLSNICIKIQIIQIFSRKSDLLPFIKTVVIVRGGKSTNTFSSKDFLSLSTQIFDIPGKRLPFIQQNIHNSKIPVVEMKGVNVQYGHKPVLQNITWKIEQGEFWQLKGPNGSGKSTLLSLITGDNPKGYGQQLYLFGKKRGSGESIWDIKRNIGIADPTQLRLFNRYETIENMVLGGFFDSVGLYIKPSELQIGIASEWLEFIGLKQDSKKAFHSLPLGKQRIVMVVRAMVKNPLLLLLDEPLVGLDDIAASLFLALINNISAFTQTSIIYVSHRDEPLVRPQRIFELMNDPNGSIGIEKEPNYGS